MVLFWLDYYEIILDGRGKRGILKDNLYFRFKVFSVRILEVDLILWFGYR